ncbi:MAG0490 family ComEA-like DNA-binding protein [Mycoplasma crocodyli]|uniref:MAG0490 family ComEA-like DNA-binding protein n=1 Tax=Mycoplasma crocodyli TaxID=50052 RepID=UPI000674E1A6|nr:hypothetical protein [Mycoplasma crocodyli]
MKKFIRIIFIFIFLASTCSIFYIVFFDYKIIKESKKIESNNTYIYITKGAFKNNDKHISSMQLTYRELFFIQGLLPEANIDSFELSNLAPVNSEIFVPFNNSLIKWNNIHEINDLVIRGISYKYASLIVNFKNKTTIRNITWQDLNDINGIGPKTIEKLKTFLILD